MSIQDTYGIIVADPFRLDRTDAEIEQFCKMIIEDISSKNCILLMWVPFKYLQDGLYLINEWGFHYYTTMSQRYAGEIDPRLLLFSSRIHCDKKHLDESISALETALKSVSSLPDHIYSLCDKLFPDRRKLTLFFSSGNDAWDYLTEQI